MLCVFVEYLQLPCREDMCLILSPALEQEVDLRYQKILKLLFQEKSSLLQEQLPRTVFL